jgi:hypothetical protein
MFKAYKNLNYFKMKKQFLNLGKALNKAEQKQIFGGKYNYGGGTCTAKCLDVNGNEFIVSCSGSSCSAVDYNGCTSDTEEKTC